MSGKETHPKPENHGAEKPDTSDFTALSARIIAQQTAVMSMMTAFGVEMAGAFMGAVANALDKKGETTSTPPEEAPVKDKVAVPPKPSRRKAAAQTDDLKRISGIGPKLEKVLNGMGVTTFADIAKWTDKDMLKMDATLGLDNRIVRDEWVRQAKALLEG